jgi:hypothetical protein
VLREIVGEVGGELGGVVAICCSPDRERACRFGGAGLALGRWEVSFVGGAGMLSGRGTCTRYTYRSR